MKPLAYPKVALKFSGSWRPVDELPDHEQKVLIVSCETVLRDLGRPCFDVNVGYYNRDKDKFRLCDDQMVKGLALFWSPMPVLPQTALAIWEGAA